MKRLLLFVMLIITLPTFAQENAINYRISGLNSTIGNKKKFIYESQISYKPICITSFDPEWDEKLIDSLSYNESGLLARIDEYYLTAGAVEHIGYEEYNYDNEGKIISGKLVVIAGIFTVEMSLSYSYDEKGRLIQLDITSEDYGGETTTFEYNDEDLIIKETYLLDYGDGMGLIVCDIITYTYDGIMLVKSEDTYYEENEIVCVVTNIYEYDELSNCTSQTTYYDYREEAGDRYEYIHDTSIPFDEVYMYVEPLEEFCPREHHSNMITGMKYFSNMGNGLELVYEHSYEYECINDKVDEISIISNIYPNPAEDIIHIEAENIDLIELYDIFGRKLTSIDAKGNTTINMCNYSNGIYFVKIYAKEESSVRKIVKK